MITQLKNLEYGTVFKYNDTYKSTDTCTSLKGAKSRGDLVITSDDDEEETAYVLCHPKLGGKFQNKLIHYLSTNLLVEVK